MTEIVVKEIENEEHEQPSVEEEEPHQPVAQLEDKPEVVQSVQVEEEKPTPAPKPKRVRPSRAKPPFDPEKFKHELVQQLKEEMSREISAKDAYYKAKEEKNQATREKLKSLASKNL